MYHCATPALISSTVAASICYQYLGKIRIIFGLVRFQPLYRTYWVYFQENLRQFYSVLQWIIRTILEGSQHSVSCTKFSIRIKANKIAIELMQRTGLNFTNCTYPIPIYYIRQLSTFRHDDVIQMVGCLVLVFVSNFCNRLQNRSFCIRPATMYVCLYICYLLKNYMQLFRRSFRYLSAYILGIFQFLITRHYLVATQHL